MFCSGSKALRTPYCRAVAGITASDARARALNGLRVAAGFGDDHGAQPGRARSLARACDFDQPAYACDFWSSHGPGVAEPPHIAAQQEYLERVSAVRWNNEPRRAHVKDDRAHPHFACRDRSRRA